ncbi:Crp/Fnr family transcriptional regulator [Helicobacter burdigaliensis]|uniref:Crp/Fnr family transcriptional regulator n=1 Tax=Helicobacter burdigaliensis TaxID=2315334 RepID=UPI000EF6720E|nr:Crp/Fnr family transcriptional regulator [Helicobacter burdigaliensis]
MAKLEEFEIFKNLPQQEIDKLQEIVKIKHFSQKEIIAYEGDISKEVLLLLKGEVKLYKVNRFGGEIFLCQLREGLLNTPKEKEQFIFANLECKKDSKVAFFSKDLLFSLFLKSPSLMHFFFIQLQEKLQFFEDVIRRELVFDSTAKIAYFLVHDLEDFNHNKKQDIAAFLNIQPETLSRILKKLSRDGMILQDKEGRVQIQDLQALKQIYKKEEHI